MSNSETKPEPISSDFNAHTRGWGHTEAKPCKRPPPFSIRFTEKERAILDREAEGKPLAEYIRLKLFDASYSPRQRGRKDAVNKAALGQALGLLGSSRISQNMNQIAKAANMGALPVTTELQRELHDACKDIQLMRDALIEAIGIKLDY